MSPPRNGRRAQFLNVLWIAGGVTMHRQCSRLLGSLILVLIGGTLVLTACNSSSGTSQTASGPNSVTGTETSNVLTTPAKGTLFEALVGKTGVSQ